MRRAASVTLLGASLAFASAAPAFADDPPPAPPPGTPPPETQPAPVPAPAQPGRLRLELSGLRSHGRSYVLQGQVVTVTGRVRPFVPGQFVRVRVSSAHRKPQYVRARVRQGDGGGGTFKVRFRARRAVAYKVFARHEATPQQVRFDARGAAGAITPAAGIGSRGIGVVLLKQGLRSLGYPAGNGPFYTSKTGRAVMAFRKVNSMARLFTANRAVFQKVLAGKGAFRLRHPAAGKHAEFDWSRQVLALAEAGKVVAVYHASSGKPSTPTVFGTFRFYSKQPGTNAKGMFDSSFFIRGYAVHGYPDVPTYPASHGCIRVPNPDAPTIFGWVEIGDRIDVYS
jgi:hypothetical protein